MAQVTIGLKVSWETLSCGGGSRARDVPEGVLGFCEKRGPGDPNIVQTWKLAQNIKTLILVTLAKNSWFGQTWFWPNLVLAKLETRPEPFWENSYNNVKTAPNRTQHATLQALQDHGKRIKTRQEDIRRRDEQSENVRLKSQLHKANTEVSETSRNKIEDAP